MQSLTLKQIQNIAADVSKSGVTFSHLHDELVDHICCMVEEDIQKGNSFDKAYAYARKVYSIKGLRKIQEDTLLLIDKKYRIMKKTMKIFGLVSLALITIGALFKIQHWLGAGIILTLGFFILGAVFMPSALWVMKKESKLKGNILIYILSIIGSLPFIFGFLFKIQHWPGAGIMLTFGFSFISILLLAILISKLLDPQSKHLRLTYIIGYFALTWYLMGTLFKIQHWPGAGVMLILGAISLTTVFFPMYVSKVYKKSEGIKASFLFLCIGIVFFNMFNLLLAINVSKNVLRFFQKPSEEIAKTTLFLENKNNRMVENIFNDTVNANLILRNNVIKIKEQADEICNFIETIKIDIIATVDGISKAEAAKKAINPSLIISKDNYYVPTNILCGNTNIDSIKGMGTEIRKELEVFKEALQFYCFNDENALNIISKALETDSVFYNNEEKFFSWEISNFYNLVTIASVLKLNYIQRNVRIAELEAIESLKSSHPEDVSVIALNN